MGLLAATLCRFVASWIYRVDVCLKPRFKLTHYRSVTKVFIIDGCGEGRNAADLVNVSLRADLAIGNW